MGEMQLRAQDLDLGAAVRVVLDHLAAGREWFELRRLLNEWDPIGAQSTPSEETIDEYSCLYNALMEKLRSGDDASVIGAYLEEELLDHFGLDPTNARPREFATRLRQWYDQMSVSDD
jgi:hypothetical protein